MFLTNYLLTVSHFGICSRYYFYIITRYYSRYYLIPWMVAICPWSAFYFIAFAFAAVDADHTRCRFAKNRSLTTYVWTRVYQSRPQPTGHYWIGKNEGQFIAKYNNICVPYVTHSHKLDRVVYSIKISTKQLIKINLNTNWTGLGETSRDKKRMQTRRPPIARFLLFISLFVFNSSISTKNIYLLYITKRASEKQKG